MIGVDVSLDKTDNLGPKTRQAVMDYLEKGADKGFSIYLERMPVDRGNMQQNSYSPTRDGNVIRYGTRDIPYAEAIDEGTDPFQPPLEPLLEWSERVSDGPGLGYYVALHKIPEEGIDAQPFSQPAKEAQERYYQSHSVQTFLDREL